MLDLIPLDREELISINIQLRNYLALNCCKTVTRRGYIAFDIEDNLRICGMCGKPVTLETIIWPK